MEKITIYELLIIASLGLAVLLLISILIFIAIHGSRKWAKERDNYYSKKFKEIESRLSIMEDGNVELIERSTEVINAVNKIIN